MLSSSHVRMVEVTRILDLRESIENFLLQRRAELKLPSPLKREYSIRVLNQEKDGCLLYTWDEITAWSQSVNVTHFGQYDPDTQRHQVLYIYNQCVHVVSASINQQRTLLAFTTYDKNGEVGRTVDVSKRSSKGIYSVFLAEIKAKNARVFSLNLERPMFLKAQFLYIDSDSDKESRMIVFLHRESVGLYSIPLMRVLEKGIVMRGQPKTEQIVKKFVWCQWDAVNQRLFYIYFRSHGDEDKDPILACLQFYSNARHDNMLSDLLEREEGQVMEQDSGGSGGRHVIQPEVNRADLTLQFLETRQDFQVLFLDAADFVNPSRWDIPALDDEIDLMSAIGHVGSVAAW